MLGEIDASDAMESAISRMLNRRDAETVSCCWAIIRFPCSREISLRQTCWILPEEGVGSSVLFQLLPMREVRCGHGLFESDIVLLNSY